jgi:hypothetical protein
MEDPRLAFYLPVLIGQAMLNMIWAASMSACEPLMPKREQSSPTIILME